MSDLHPGRLVFVRRCDGSERPAVVVRGPLGRRGRSPVLVRPLVRGADSTVSVRRDRCIVALSTMPLTPADVGRAAERLR